jgi:biotin transporter BioY
VSDTLILSCGWAYLSTFMGPYQAWLVGVAPYLMWDLVKILTTSVVVSSYGLRHKLSQF